MIAMLGKLSALAFSGNLEASDLILGAGVLVIVAWVVMTLFQRAKAGSRPPGPGAGTGAEPGAGSGGRASAPRTRDESTAKGVQRDLEELVVEIERLTSRLGAEFEQRSARLEALLREADQKIAELRRLRGEDSQSKFTMSASTRSAFASETPAIPQAPAGAGDAATPGQATTAVVDQHDDAVARSVCALADAGHDSVEIARRLREHVGKVELILALRRG